MTDKHEDAAKKAAENLEKAGKKVEEKVTEASKKVEEQVHETGKKIEDHVNEAGEKVRNFVEEQKINEQLEVAGNQLVDRVKSLIDEGNVRRLIIRNPEGRTLLEIPLTAGVAVGGAVLWFTPMLAGLGAIAALLARVNIEVVREEPEGIIKDAKKKVEDIVDDLSEDE